ncbi:hypothetical protein [Novosphingobium sp.]|uniref:hypothetical protein n=1 Tax=Novosphingobium sp. TaxID=1874826 RepID=UPI00262692B8|nr:hypothetical protein [Novosphingobium sp.]
MPRSHRWVEQSSHRLAGLDQSLGEPAGASARPEEIAGAHDQAWHGWRRVRKTLLKLNTDTLIGKSHFK